MAIRRGQLGLVLMSNMSEIFIWATCYGLFCKPYQYQAWQKHSDPKQLERRDKMMDDGNYQFQDIESRKIILLSVWTKPDTELGALFLLVSEAGMRILLFLPSESKAPASVLNLDSASPDSYPGQTEFLRHNDW